MIQTLHIKNIGIIDDININLNEGFNVLTGETGAGKREIMNKEQILGMTNTIEEEVTFETTAAFIEPSTPAVYSTPKLVALAEKACLEMLKPVCEEGEVSVGVTISLTHSAPTPIGM